MACIPLDTVVYLIAGFASAVALATRAAWSFHVKTVERMSAAIDRLDKRHLSVLTEVVERATSENEQWRLRALQAESDAEPRT